MKILFYKYLCWKRDKFFYKWIRTKKEEHLWKYQVYAEKAYKAR